MVSNIQPDIHGILLHGQAIVEQSRFVAKYNEWQIDKTGSRKPVQRPSRYDNFNTLPFQGNNPTDYLMLERDSNKIEITNKNIHIASTIFACLDALVRLSMSTSIYTNKNLKLNLESKIQHWETIVIDILSSICICDSKKANQLVNFALDLFAKGIPSATSHGDANSTEVAFRQEDDKPEATRNYWAKILAAANTNSETFLQVRYREDPHTTYFAIRQQMPNKFITTIN